ncbi:MAG: M28 family peptidase [Gammaproteobacteria bacterium]|nr:M28 family peptidase [Gammaproteobacteria bacterium]
MLSTAAIATAAAPNTPQFSDANLRSSIRTLSSDAFAGRAPDTIGERKSIAFIAARLREYGLQPADHGSYFQDVPLLQITANPDASLSFTGGKTPLTLRYGTDMMVYTERPVATISLRSSPLVFAGYGIVAPEYHWNDYAGLDVRGKTVVVLVNDPGYASGDPKLFDGKAMTYYGRWTYKYEEAARQGAAGILIVHQTGPAGYPWAVVHNSMIGAREELAPGTAYRTAVEGWLTHAAAIRVFAASGLDFDRLAAAAASRTFKPVPLHQQVSVTLHNQVRSIVSHNVVGILRGNARPDEALVYSAHWDHFGTRRGPDGKAEIFHGAVDNGSGIASLLELARVFASTHPHPRRSVLFLATTAEEQGLLGAAYYAHHPLVPLADTVADFNMDVMNVYGPTRDIEERGQAMSTLDDDLRAAAHDLGLVVNPDAEPEKGYYFRADHFEFAKAGVPALSIQDGTDFVGRPAGWGIAQLREYTRFHYHKPADVYDPHWNLGGLRQELQVLYLAGRRLADGEEWPAWRAGSPFLKAREAERPASR